jgi:hypothetical protein
MVAEMVMTLFTWMFDEIVAEVVASSTYILWSEFY